MQTTQPHNETVSTDEQFDDRDVRALTECMTVISTDAPGMFEVTTQSGSEYLVDGRHGSCSCPDAEHRDVRCKHIRRVAFATGDRPIPTWVNADAVDEQLGDHVGGPVMTDGGRLFPDHSDTHRAIETERVDGGALVYRRVDVGRRLIGFADVHDWDALRTEVIRRGHGAGAIHDLDVYEPEEVGL